MLVTRRLPIHATLGDAVITAEVFGADRAAVRAGLAGAVVVPANNQHRRRAAALGACDRPNGRTTEGPLCGECCLTPLRRVESPLHALHQNGGLDELQGMDDGADLTAPYFFSAATLGERRDG
ncbi:MAG TPA: hypothetical protein VF978_04315, partial [Gemmatimonadales bacterium]